mmetsp:Transcript_29399/g.68053  ORF Transcript_29399/g.68053 Transcript_29399/m.68053 type:complete len:85 (+) Transcript_29399:43-297(+)
MLRQTFSPLNNKTTNDDDDGTILVTQKQCKSEESDVGGWSWPERMMACFAFVALGYLCYSLIFGILFVLPWIYLTYALGSTQGS